MDHIQTNMYSRTFEEIQTFTAEKQVSVVNSGLYRAPLKYFSLHRYVCSVATRYTDATVALLDWQIQPNGHSIYDRLRKTLPPVISKDSSAAKDKVNIEKKPGKTIGH